MSGQDPLVADHVNLGSTDLGVELDSRVARRGEEQEDGEKVVEPVADHREHHDSPRVELQRRVERELEIGGVLLGGMALDARARRFRRAYGLG